MNVELPESIVEEEPLMTTVPSSIPADTRSTVASASGAASTGFDHPDGIFDPNTVTETAEMSVSVADQPDVLDLLTTTF